MSKRTTGHTIKEKADAVLDVMNKGYSINQVAKEYQVDTETINYWIKNFKHDGMEGLKESYRWKDYSPDLKREAVEYYLNGEGSLRGTCDRYNISSHSVLRGWIKRYTSGKEVKSTSKGRSKRMNKGRKTTWKERIEIAQYTIAHEKDYQKTQEKYNVSYQQVYGWVRKYEKDGESALQDRRGRTLESKQTLTEEEKLQLRIQELEERAKYLEMKMGY
jgi:transposase-like protein